MDYLKNAFTGLTGMKPKVWTDEDYVRFALSQHGEKLTEETAKRMTIVTGPPAQNQDEVQISAYFLDYDTDNSRKIMQRERSRLHGDTYFDSMKCKICLD